MKWLALILGLLSLTKLSGQQTEGQVAGYITKNGYAVSNVMVVLSSLFHKETYTSYSNSNGYYRFTNIQAGEGYYIKAISNELDSTIIQPVHILIGETIQLNISLEKKATLLNNIVLKSSIPQRTHSFTVKTATELSNNQHLYGGLFQQFPQLQILQNGGLSIAQQNPRLNAFYIDGAIQNDIFGLSATGISGAQTFSFPIQKEEVEQVQVVSSSFDASLGNYTGGSINITTKAGTNKAKQRYFTENGFGNVSQQRVGVQLSGPIIQNKLWYSFAIDKLGYDARKEFTISQYTGNLNNNKQLELVAHTIQSIYNYDIGDPHFEDSRQQNRISFRTDWLLPKNQKLVLSFRFFQHSRINTNISNANALHFSNSAKQFQGSVIYGNIEYKKWWKHSSNRLLFSVYRNKDIVSSGNSAFPALRILDGEAMIYAGNQPDAMQNTLNQQQFFLYNKFQIQHVKNSFSIGTEVHHSNIVNCFLPNSFGTYFYYSLADFLQNKRAGSYERNIFSSALSEMKYTRAAFFIQAERKFNTNWQIQAGIRVTLENIKGVALGKQPSLSPVFAPRISFTYQNIKKGWRIHAGAGLFSGTIPLAWLSGIYLFNGTVTNTYRANSTALKTLRFNPDPYLQWHPSQLNDTFYRPTLNLIQKRLRMPQVLKFAGLVRKDFANTLFVQADFLFFFNKEEIGFKNIGLQEPTIQLNGPDKRIVYDSSNGIAGNNQVYLLENTKKASGYGYQIQIQMRKKLKNSSIEIAYAMGDAFSMYDGNYNILANQWKLNESVAGRNKLERSRSDYSLGSHSQLRFNKLFSFGKQQVTLTAEYIGRSGSPFSYVYGEKSLVQDDRNSPGFDLLYIPSFSDLQQQLFVPIISSGYYYTPGLQKDLLDDFIESNVYLRNRRGNYAERNGSRHPFIHQCNLYLSYQFPIRLYRNKLYTTVYFSLFNVQEYLFSAPDLSPIQNGNQVKLINFMGYVNGTYTPQYSFNPEILQKTSFQQPSRLNPEQDRFFYLKTGISISFY